MRDALFRRRAVVIVGQTRVEELRVSFKVVKSLRKEPNTAEVSIYNLAATTRASLQKKGEPLVLMAGYEASFAVIFSGVVRDIRHRPEGAEWVTRVLSGDGERAYQYDFASESFAPGTRVADVAAALVRRLGVDNADALAKVAQLPGQFVHGYAAHGRVAVELDRLLKPRGYSFSIQDGRLQVLQGSRAAQGQAVVLAPDTGLIGTPEFGAPEKEGGPSVLRVKSLLQPSLRPGGVVELRSSVHRGQFRCARVTHSGDSAGADWHTEIEAEVKA